MKFGYEFISELSVSLVVSIAKLLVQRKENLDSSVFLFFLYLYTKKITNCSTVNVEKIILHLLAKSRRAQV
jgi:hypothetical protein